MAEGNRTQIPEFLIRALAIIKEAVDALIEQFSMDDQMKKLHQQIKVEVGKKRKKLDEASVVSAQSVNGQCECTDGALWIEEIIKEEYWNKTPEKHKVKKAMDLKEGKHSGYIHIIMSDNEQGYLNLASQFLMKNSMNDTRGKNTIPEYLDSLGILRLLINCAAFDTKNVAENLQKIIKERNEMAHIPHAAVKMLPDEQAEKVRCISKSTVGALCGIIDGAEYGELCVHIGELKNVKLEKLVAGSRLDRDIECFKVEWREFNSSPVGDEREGSEQRGTVNVNIYGRNCPVFPGTVNNSSFSFNN